jgi:hypothetical protein
VQSVDKDSLDFFKFYFGAGCYVHYLQFVPIIEKVINSQLDPESGCLVPTGFYADYDTTICTTQIYRMEQCDIPPETEQ